MVAIQLLITSVLELTIAGIDFHQLLTQSLILLRKSRVSIDFDIDEPGCVCAYKISGNISLKIPGKSMNT